MSGSYDCFVVFAEMRTGSNFLETNLNAIDGIRCHGEAFNPHFIAYPNRTELLDISQKQRDSDPHALLRAIRKDRVGLAGFRYFHDHDPRVLDAILEDPKCAKIMLSRNPVDSYVSWKIARQTGQWKLTKLNRRKDAKTTFDATEFLAQVQKNQAFQKYVLSQLQQSGQVPFRLDYDDLQSVEVMNGLAAWLGAPTRLSSLDQSLKRQNPGSTLEKVSNPEDIAKAVANLDRFELGRVPNFEPRRGAVVPTYMAAPRSPLLYLPIQSGPEALVRNWLAAADDLPIEEIQTGLTQKQLRQWKRRSGNHRSFTVLRHPVARTYAAFCDCILPSGSDLYPKIRNTLRREFGMAVPDDLRAEEYSLEMHKSAFVAFLEFLQANLAGQTSTRVDGNWATQSEVLSGFGGFALPDYVLREEELTEMLPHIARQVGHTKPPPVSAPDEPRPFALKEIYDEQIERQIGSIYRRDYMMFGFGPWKN